MDPIEGSWASIKEMAADALELPAEERPAFLDRVCTDPRLRTEVEGLIRAFESPGGSGDFLESPPLDLLSAMVTSEGPSPDPASALQDALAGSYTIEGELGRGGMATVYLARDERHGRRVAVKVVHPHIAALDTSTDGSRFQREIRIAARLSHPHILPLHDSGAAAGLLYYIMPFVDGESLRARMAREPVPLADALRVLRDVVRALAHAHHHGVVHRDIKPENILLNREGDALVADFGVAKALEAAATEAEESHGTSLSSVSLQFGTPAYMAPEQAVPSAATDQRADLYSLGVVAYELLAGAPPFRQRGRDELLKAHQDEQPEPLAGLCPDLPPALTTLVMELLAKAPADRPPNAAEVLRTLEAAAPAPAHRVGRRRLPVLAGGLLLITALVVAVLPGAGSNAVEGALAVLPFQNLSAEGPHAYFAAGLHDELLTQFSEVAGLSLRGRASVMGYAGSTKSVKEIGEELQVGALVQASVQVVGERLRLNVQLVDVATDRTLWAERYDRTLDDAFAIQSDVAKQVVAAVRSALSSAELRGMTEAPTANAEAYRFYLQGRGYFLRSGRLRQDYEAAQQLYERAVALDPAFALAHVALAEVHALMHRLRYDPSPERLTRAITEAETAIRLAPDLPKAHEAMGLAHALGRGDFHRALDAYLRAAQGLPNDARLWQRIGFANRGLGSWDKAIAALRKSTELDPYDADLFFHLGITEGLARRFADAARALDRAQSLAPDLHAAPITKAWIYARWQGQLDTLEAVLARLPQMLTMGAEGDVAAHRGRLYLWDRKPDRLLQVLRTARGPVFESEVSFQPVALYRAWAHRLAGDEPGARAAFDSARVLLDARLAELPDDWRARAARGLALAGLGRREAALQEVRRLEESAGNADGYFRPQLSEDRVRILAQIGEADSALAGIERLLKGPSTLTTYALQRDPLWDPIREHPRFRQLVAQYRLP